MINLLWKVHLDSCQFFAEPFPHSTLPVMVDALVDDVQTNTMLTCPVVKFLGSVTPTFKHDKQDPGANTKPAGSLGKQPTKNPSIPSIWAPVVKKLNSLYLSVDISTFACMSGMTYL